jgi:hypothetical protein
VEPLSPLALSRVALITQLTSAVNEHGDEAGRRGSVPSPSSRSVRSAVPAMSMTRVRGIGIVGVSPLERDYNCQTIRQIDHDRLQ